jgi:hypothetical protein
MNELILFCFQRTGSSVFGKWLTDAGYVDFKEIYAFGFDYNILNIPKFGEATTEEYIIHLHDNYIDKECAGCHSFENKNLRMLNEFGNQHKPNKFLYKMFLSWHSYYSQQEFYRDYIRDKKKVLLIRRDFIDWASSIALQNLNIYLGHTGNHNSVNINVSDDLLNSLFLGYQSLLAYVDDIDYIIVYEDAIRDKLVDSELEAAFGIFQNFNKHVNSIDNPYMLKTKHVTNFDSFAKSLDDTGYVDKYTQILNDIYQKYIVSGNGKLIGKLIVK